MTDKKAQDDRHAGNKWTPVLVAIVGAALGSLGTISIYIGTPAGQKIARPDPFTGSQADALIARIGHLETKINGHMFSHPDRALELRVNTLESNYNHLVETLDRIERKMDAR